MMTTLLIDLLIVFWLLLFGAMALLPIITGGHRHTAHETEDRVISIAPARMTPQRPMGTRMPLAQDDDHREPHAA